MGDALFESLARQIRGRFVRRGLRPGRNRDAHRGEGDEQNDGDRTCPHARDGRWRPAHKSGTVACMSQAGGGGPAPPKPAPPGPIKPPIAANPKGPPAAPQGTAKAATPPPPPVGSKAPPPLPAAARSKAPP